VTGSISLRRADGSIASGLDGSLLAVEVLGGTLVRSASKVSHGFFQFVVSGRRGDGGKSISVRVVYDGEQIGEVVTLPVAIDEWAVDADATADGGLQCAASSSGNRSAQGSFAALLLLALARWRRRRA
jgi:MYXO-CTERM domain-containing protein